MNRGKNHVVSRASRVMITSTRTCACVRLGELPSPCDTRDGEGVFRQMIMPMIGRLAVVREAYPRSRQLLRSQYKRHLRTRF